MCLILFAYRCDADRPLIVAANRDEFYARPALPAHFWDDEPRIFGGRDLEARGTWLAVSTNGRFAAVTNWTQDLTAPRPPGSRGDLPRHFLNSDISARDYVRTIDGPHFTGFNLIAFDGKDLVYTSNRTDEVRILEPGVYGLTNTRLGDEWSKSVRGAAALERYVTSSCGSPALASLIELLLDHHVPPDDELPLSGRDRETARRAAPCFIRGDTYGTRASTAVIVAQDQIQFREQLYEPQGVPAASTDEAIALTPV